MSQRVTLRVDMAAGERLRRKAMQIASGTLGVRSVSIQGQNDTLVVLGEEIDIAELTRQLRRRVGYARILTVQAASTQPPPPPPSPPRRCTCEIPNSGFCELCRSSRQPLYPSAPPCPPPAYYEVVNVSYPDTCRIL